MKKRAFLFFIFIYLIMLSACSSVDRDAKEAAEESAKSISYTAEGKWENAEKHFNKFRQKESKYKETDDFKAFHEAYQKYLLEITISKQQ